MFFQGLYSALQDDPPGVVLRFVQRTGKNEPFFLCHREFMNGDRKNNPLALKGDAAACVPWLAFNSTNCGSIAIPTFAEHVCEVGFMTRLLTIMLCRYMECTVCLSRVEAMKNLSQLPCVHFMCTDCLVKLYPLNKRGVSCPTCKTSYANYALMQMDGGVALAEQN